MAVSHLGRRTRIRDAINRQSGRRGSPRHDHRGGRSWPHCQGRQRQRSGPAQRQGVVDLHRLPVHYPGPPRRRRGRRPRAGHRRVWRRDGLWSKWEKKADGAFAVSEEFRNPDFGAHTQPPVLHGGHFYSHYTINERSDGLVAMSMDGQVKWKTDQQPGVRARRLDPGRRPAADDRRQHQAVSLEPSPTVFKPLASAVILEAGDNWAPLALVDGKLLVRGQKQLTGAAGGSVDAMAADDPRSLSLRNPTMLRSQPSRLCTRKGRGSEAQDVYGDIVRRHQRRALEDRLASSSQRRRTRMKSCRMRSSRCTTHRATFRLELTFQAWFTRILIKLPSSIDSRHEDAAIGLARPHPADRGRARVF